jgi:hypothetical protein
MRGAAPGGNFGDRGLGANDSERICQHRLKKKPCCEIWVAGAAISTQACCEGKGKGDADGGGGGGGGGRNGDGGAAMDDGAMVPSKSAAGARFVPPTADTG